MNELAGWINETYPGIYVRNIEIGNGYEDSLFMPMNKQVELFCQQIFSDENLKDGFSLLGFSQGSLITRAAVQRCSFPNAYNLITLSGIHGGEFGIPYIELLPPKLREFATKYMYTDYVQKLISFAGYWRDPYQLDKYYTESQFLSVINNEGKTRNETYRQNLLKLNAFVMTYSDIDEIISPLESGWFMSYGPNSLKVQLWNDSREFQEDLVGMRTHLDQGRLHTYISHCKHQDNPHKPNKEFLFKNIMQYFNNTL
ncbi:unnamed protein product [Didymodactylos carnosus]|uniref:Palmitoyl-protein thioesterase 1 n=1 Tax=Didymodactylos carnosus TaxID=1234261 RepID=A0A814YJE7_9BILA|nr:unnamed protein product [Didymodactylos carnosus]CAF3993847.1 unnamed protein product [Didymodactylos carnosus]